MKLPTFIKWARPFSSSGLLDVVFHSAFMFHLSISTSIVNKKVILEIKFKFFLRIIVIDIVIVVNSGQAIIACILVAYTVGDIVLSLH